MTLPAFVCTPQRGARLTVASCRRMQEEATATASAPAGSAAAMKNSACRGCTVGIAHGAGELPERWSDGSPVVRLELGMHHAAPMLAPAQPPPPARPTPKPLVRRRPIADRDIKPENVTPKHEDTMAKRELTHNGITDTLAGWGKRTGMTGAGIASRLARGMSVADALSTPKSEQAAENGSHKGRASSAKKPRQRPTKPRKAPKLSAPVPVVPTAAEAVREALGEVGPVELLRASGWDARPGGKVPAGLVIIIADPKG